MSTLPSEDQPPFMCTIIGAGPGGMATLIHAARSYKLPFLLQGISNRSGVVLLDAGTASQTGAGRLGRYQIPSRHDPARFHVTPVLADRSGSGVNQPESICGTVLESLAEHKEAVAIRKCGKHSCMLATIGNLMKDVATKIIEKIQQETPKSFFLECTRATNITVLKNKSFEVTATRRPASNTDNNNGEEEEEVFKFRTKAVIIATGGLQIPPPFLKPYQDKVLRSRDALTSEGREKMLQAMKANGSNKIVVVGSGHSAYSVIWMLLNSFANGKCYTGSTRDSSSEGASSSVPKSQCEGKEQPAFFPGTFEKDDITCVYKQVQFSPISEGTQLLYEAIKRHEEHRVRRMDLEASSPKALRTVYKQATTIVWAGGYGSNMVPVRHPDGTKYNFAMRGTKVKVDGSSQLLRQLKPKGDGKPVEKPLEHLFGMGVGFGHQDDVIDGIGTFVSYRAPSVLAHITNGCFDKLAAQSAQAESQRFKMRTLKKLQAKQKQARDRAQKLALKNGQAAKLEAQRRAEEKRQKEERIRRVQAKEQKELNKADEKAQKQRVKSIVAFKEKMAQTAKEERRARERKEKSLSKRRAQARRQALRMAKRVGMHYQRPKNCEHELSADDQDLNELLEPSSSMVTGTNQEVDVSSYDIPRAIHPSSDQARLPRLTHSVTVFASPELFLGRTYRKKTHHPKPIVYGRKAPKSRLVVIKPTSNITYGNLLHPTPNPAAKYLYGNTVQQCHNSPVQNAHHSPIKNAHQSPIKNTHSTRHTKHHPSPTRKPKLEGPGGRFLRTKNVVLDLSDTFAPLCIRGSPPARQNTYGYVFT